MSLLFPNYSNKFKVNILSLLYLPGIYAYKFINKDSLETYKEIKDDSLETAKKKFQKLIWLLELFVKNTILKRITILQNYYIIIQKTMNYLRTFQVKMIQMLILKFLVFKILLKNLKIKTNYKLSGN